MERRSRANFPAASVQSAPLALPSLAERDRRWSAVRWLMERGQIDALLVAGIGDAQADARYLTNIPSTPRAPVWLVWPDQGQPIALCRRTPVGTGEIPWVECWEAGANSEMSVALDFVRRLPLRHRRLGAIGLGAAGAEAERLRAMMARTVSDVDVVDCTDALQRLRAHKSDEEIALLQQAAGALDAAFGHMDRVARSGIPTHELWAAGVGAICRLTGEMPRSTRWATAARPRLLTRPSGGLLVTGMLAIGQFEAVSGGYAVRAAHAVAIDACGPITAELYATLGGLWIQALEAVQPGSTFGAVQRRVRAAALKAMRARGPSNTVTAWVSVHGAGLGADLPRLDGRRTSPSGSLPAFEPGWAFSLAVWLRATVEGRQYLTVWEDPVVVGPTGAIRLGSRAPGALTSHPLTERGADPSRSASGSPPVRGRREHAVHAGQPPT